MASIIYQYPSIYRVVMRILYGKHFSARYQEVAKLIPSKAQVVEVCAGDCYLYSGFLKSKGIEYWGLDLSCLMLKRGEKYGAKTAVFDMRKDELPVADYLVMQGSLCQFIPEAESIILKMLAATRHKLIIAEPVRNWSSSSSPILSFLGRRLTRPPGDCETYSGERFDETSLKALFEKFPSFERASLIPGGREMIGVFGGHAK